MNNLSNRGHSFFRNDSEDENSLWEYMQELHPETIAKLSQPSSAAAEIMERNLRGMLGALPPEHFGVTITTSRENLGRMLASAMMSGYFLHNAEQRQVLEQSLKAGATGSSES
ncbi:DUF760 domain-containing protein [Laspinema olomoucense]|uniref:DUF760 domain-containing protein n=1 Tax=Laspinema olomoucense D3b TaxID=2953688 RepID=A0ABT2N1Y2_9CYAN|nr:MULTISPECIES: DUF760 domain-containing protein [unclassified Laspinema]MCT7972847.1 DUF760 domain-containing protein [Laspinema sp. D3d]MCT7976688.1 DUF760 domain-containing protein [Laspinema sp. D3b]MCT7995615.1 DUF760 domain-containing protein [Laspinema sp. D3c]